MEIGSKLKEARMRTEFTQEQVSDAIGVSRQTISNWENEKSYPDIVSVIKLSDLYDVSLDYLLKGKETKPMLSYMDYLEESTNTVKSKQKLTKHMEVGIYVILWSPANTSSAPTLFIEELKLSNIFCIVFEQS